MKKVLITGCAGFIGFHLSEFFLEKNFSVIGVDNLSRKGSKINLNNLLKKNNFYFHKTDIRNFSKIQYIFKKYRNFDLIIHEAGQVAVTSSIISPLVDFEINAFGTLNLLENFRLYSPKSLFIFASTNKVYGNLNDIKILKKTKRYEFNNLPNGINEKFNLDFHSPYGCSKGCADQYVRDYHRIYNLKTVVLRQSCIYGTRQYGVEDQGWVAWFIIATILGKKITIYGDGRQVRDLLWIDDLINAHIKIYRNPDKVAGKIFNIGGGSKNTISLLELIDYLRTKKLLTKNISFSSSRSGDQKIYISDFSEINRVIDWKPEITISTGLEKLTKWVFKNKDLLRKII